jgi:hypothetical protein
MANYSHYKCREEDRREQQVGLLHKHIINNRKDREKKRGKQERNEKE